MTRDSGVAFKGLIVSQSGDPTTNQTLCSRLFISGIFAQMDSYIPDGWSVPAWEMLDNLGTYDRVYKSVGDKLLNSGSGDAAIFLRVTSFDDGFSENPVCQPYQCWLSGVGGVRPAYESLSQFETVYYFGQGLIGGGPDSFGTMYYGGKLNAYQLTVFAEQSGDTEFGLFGGGVVRRTHVHPSERGVAFLSTTASSGSNVVLSLDRNLSGSVVVGQRFWGYNLVGSGGLPDERIYTGTLLTVGAGTVTIDSLEGTLLSGAIVGLDPCPAFAFGGQQGWSWARGINMADGRSPRNTAGANNFYTIEPGLNGIMATVNRPHTGTGDWLGSEAAIGYDGNGGSGYPPFRGTLDHLIYIHHGYEYAELAVGTGAFGTAGYPGHVPGLDHLSLARHNYDNDQMYWTFPYSYDPGTGASYYRPEGSTIPAIGPGAY